MADELDFSAAESFQPFPLDDVETPIVEIPTDTTTFVPSNDEPPRRTRSPRAERAPRRGRRPALAPRIEQMYTLVGATIALVPKDGTKPIGNSVITSAKPAAKAWENAAKEYPAIADAWEKILAVSVIGELLTAHLPILMAIYQVMAANGDTNLAPLLSVVTNQTPGTDDASA